MPRLPKAPPESQVPSSPSPAPAAAILDPLPGVLDHCSVNLLAGASGVGKTCLTAWLLTRFRDNLPIFGLQPNKVPKIAYLCADRGWSSTKQWFERTGFPDIPHYSLTDDMEFEPGRLEQKRSLIPILRESLAKLNPLPPGSLVVIDPIAIFMGGNLNDYQSCAVSLIRMRRLALEMQITIIGLCHASKQKSDSKEQYKRLQDRIVGSTAQHGYGDTQMYLASPEETGAKFYTFLYHPHVSKARTIQLDRDDATGLFIPWKDGTSPDADALKIVEGKILHLIPSTPEGIGFGELLEAATPEISRSTVHRYVQQLLAEGVIDKAAYGRYRRPRAN